MAVTHQGEGLDQRGAHIFEACCVAAQEVEIDFDTHLIFDRFDGAMIEDSTEFGLHYSTECGLYYESGRAVLRPDTDDSVMQVGLTYMGDHDLGAELQCYAITPDKREIWDIGSGPEFLEGSDLWSITAGADKELLAMIERVAKAAAKSYATQEPLP